MRTNKRINPAANQRMIFSGERAIHRFNLLCGFVKQFFLQWLSMRGFTLALVANQAITPLIGLAVWTTALPERNLAAYYIALMFVRLFCVSYEQHTFSGRICNGELADDLLQPRPVIFRPLSENLAIRVWHLIIGAPLLIAALIFVPVQFEVRNIVLALPALALAAMLQFLFTYALSMSAFWTERAHGVTGIGMTLTFLLGGEAAPIQMFPASVLPLAEVLPFRAMLGFPAEIATGMLGASEMLVGYGWQIVWLGVFGLIVSRAWSVGLRRYAAVGG